MPEVSSFAYEAQSADGHIFSGTIDAVAITDAAAQLQSLQLQLTRLEPIARPTPAPLNTADFLLFNQQLAHLTAGGLPVERSLRLMAREMGGKQQSAALNTIADELEKGTPLPQAFAAQSRNFPPLYVQLLEAGIRGNNLPGMLFNLGRHVQFLERLRAAWWRAASYPLMVLFALLMVMSFIWTWILPQFLPLSYGPVWQQTSYGFPQFVGMGVDPGVQFFLWLANVVGYSVMALIAAVLLTTLACIILSRTGRSSSLVESFVLPIPLIGPILKWNLIARWCDALHLGVQAGMPLPTAIGMARDAVDSSRLRLDSQSLIDTITAGNPLDADAQVHFLPPLVPASLQMGIDRNDLPAAVAILTQMYQEQAEIRLALLPRVLSPLLLILTAACIGLAVCAMIMPLVAIIRSLSGG
jgi:type II secretory pathway component PulF